MFVKNINEFTKEEVKAGTNIILGQTVGCPK